MAEATPEYLNEVQKILDGANITYRREVDEDGWLLLIPRTQLKGEHRLRALMAASEVPGATTMMSGGDDAVIHGHG